MRRTPLLLALIAGLTAVPPLASAQPPAPQQQLSSPAIICPMIESAAQANSLPIDFFTRLIWQESHFRPDVLGPLTRGGQRAEGIAQFMPATAAEHQLLQPFNPVEALPKAGELLANLRARFGNLGLAAAAYNAGPQRVHDFLYGAGGLPAETRKYVLSITGRPIEDWLKSSASGESEGGLNSKTEAGKADCYGLAVPMRAPQAQLPPSNISGPHVPQWCMHLRHPNPEACGATRQPELTLSSMTKLTRRTSLKNPSINKLR